MSVHADKTFRDESGVDFRKSPNLQYIERSRSFLGAYLVALAAYQRGLQVSFLYASENVRRDDGTGSHMKIGHNFSLSDGKKRFRFSNTSGPFTTNFARRVTRNKNSEKVLYQKSGIPVPGGMLTSKAAVEADLDKLKEDFQANRFVIKPFDGSLGWDTHVDQTADEILELAKNFSADEFMLEEFVRGPEYRFTVVEGKCVGVFERRAPHVVGDGFTTVKQLISLKNEMRKNNPFLYAKPIDPKNLIHGKDYRNQVLSQIPKDGEIVTLSNLQRVGVGGEPWDVSEDMPQAFKDIAVSACRCIQARNAGVDIIIGSLEDIQSARVLESNVRHHIEGHSFCENKKVWDNKIAEAMVDMYFPKTKRSPRNVNAFFDHSKVRLALETQCFSAIYLPKLANDWVARNFLFGVTPAHKVIRKAILPTIAEFRVHMSEVVLDEKTSCMTLTAPAQSFEKFLEKTGILNSLALADEIEALTSQS